jgi:hypothetical protein
MSMSIDYIQPVPILLSFENAQWLIVVHKAIPPKGGNPSVLGCIRFHRRTLDGVDESRASFRASPELTSKGLADPYALKHFREQYQRQLDSLDSPLTLIGRKLLKEKVKTIALLQKAISEGLIQNYHLDLVRIRPSQSIS